MNELIEEAMLRKPSGLINYSRKSLSVDAQKMLTLVSWVCQYTESDEDGLYYLKKGFAKNFLGGRNSGNYTPAQNAVEELYEQSVEWNNTGIDRTYEYGKMRLIITLIAPSKSGNYYAFEIHNKLDKVIKNPRLYANQAIIMMALLTKPKESWPFYEKFLDCLARGEHRLKQSLEESKEACGIAQNKYKKYVDYKKRILKPVADIISKKTDIKVTFEPYRNGRKIAGIIWEFEKRPWQTELFTEPTMHDLQGIVADYEKRNNIRKVIEDPQILLLVESYGEFNVPKALVDKAIKEIGVDGVIETREYVLAKAKKKGLDIPKTGAFLADALRKGYGCKSPGEREREKEKKQEQELKIKTEEANQKKEEAENEFFLSRIEKAKQLYESLPSEKQEETVESFIATLPVFLRKMYNEKGLNSPALTGVFNDFIKTKLLSAEDNDFEKHYKEHS